MALSQKLDLIPGAVQYQQQYRWYCTAFGIGPFLSLFLEVFTTLALEAAKEPRLGLE